MVEMEQELASIFSFVLKAAGNPTPYYRNLPQSFRVPAAYFPIPEITTSGDTFHTYGAQYSWYIKLIHSSTQDAYQLGLQALTAIKENRNLIPLLDESGQKLGKGIRIQDPEIKVIAECTVQLNIRFTSRRPYANCSGSLAKKFSTDVRIKPDPRTPERVTYETKLTRTAPIGVEESESNDVYEHDLCGTKPQSK